MKTKKTKVKKIMRKGKEDKVEGKRRKLKKKQ